LPFRTQILLRGRLHQDPNAQALVKPILFPNWGVRIGILQSGRERWNIRVTRTGFAIRAGREYRMRLKVRADLTRRIVFGVWRDHAPWDCVGHCEELEVLSQWQMVEWRFVASAGEALAYLGVWLGGDCAALELCECSLRAIPPETTGVKG